MPLENVPSMQVKGLSFTVFHQQLKIMTCHMGSVCRSQSCPLWKEFNTGMKSMGYRVDYTGSCPKSDASSGSLGSLAVYASPLHLVNVHESGTKYVVL